MPDALSLASLVAGGVSQVFGFGRWMVSAAAWVTPVLLLHFAHAVDPTSGTIAILVVTFCTTAITQRGIIDIKGPLYFAVVAAIAVGLTAPFAIDRLTAPHLSGLRATLVFPLAWTSVEYLAMRFSPYGTWGALGYTQHDNLPLMQLGAATGIWGLGFAVAWGASSAEWTWTHASASAAFVPGLVFVLVLALILFAGGVRLLRAMEGPTVRIAGVGWPDGILEIGGFERSMAADLSATQREQFRAQFRAVEDSLFSRSLPEAEAGSRIIVWPEICLLVYAEDEPRFVERAQAFAAERGVHLVVGMAVITTGRTKPLENRSMIFSPDGTAVAYTKRTAVPGFEATHSATGLDPARCTASEHGALAAPICFDLDFPWVVRRRGAAPADILLVPASDWPAIKSLHQLMAECRAIENGSAVFRMTRWGHSGAVDAYGRRLAAIDSLAHPENVLVAHVPSRGMLWTPQRAFGDWFAWVAIAGLCAELAVAATAI